jgi:hypothetical protein
MVQQGTKVRRMPDEEFEKKTMKEEEKANKGELTYT